MSRYTSATATVRCNQGLTSPLSDSPGHLDRRTEQGVRNRTWARPCGASDRCRIHLHALPDCARVLLPRVAHAGVCMGACKISLDAASARIGRPRADQGPHLTRWITARCRSCPRSGPTAQVVQEPRKDPGYKRVQQEAARAGTQGGREEKTKSGGGEDRYGGGRSVWQRAGEEGSSSGHGR